MSKVMHIAHDADDCQERDHSSELRGVNPACQLLDCSVKAYLGTVMNFVKGMSLHSERTTPCAHK
jgi:hypothetical protein